VILASKAARIRVQKIDATKPMKQLTTSTGKIWPVNQSLTRCQTGTTAMLKPTFRFFIIPLGAICTLASLSSQNAAPRAQHDTGSMLVRQQVIDCSNKNPSDVCVISTDEAR
jgi:hypothetical protein